MKCLGTVLAFALASISSIACTASTDDGQPEEVAQQPNTPVQQAQSDAMRRSALVGTGAQVAERLRALADTLSVAEISVITWTHDPAAARRSYELLAQHVH